MLLCMIESATFDRLDLPAATHVELITGNRLMPRRADLLTLAKASDEVAAWLKPRLRKEVGGGGADVIFASKGWRGARPLHMLHLEDRVLYRSVLEALKESLPEELTTRGPIEEFRKAPLAEAGTRYITQTDVTAYYEFVDHDTLMDELLAQTGEELLIDILALLLARVMGRRVGLPQVSHTSDILGDTYIDVARRRLIRRGFATFTYSDDFRIATRTLGGARAALEACAAELRELGLVLNERKTFTFGRPKYKASLGAFRKAELDLFDDSDTLISEDYSDDEDELLDTENQMLSTDAVGGEIDEAEMVIDDANEEARESPAANQVRAAERALQLWLEEEEDDATQFGMQAAITQSLLGHALPVLGAAGVEDPLENLSALLRHEPGLTPQVSRYLVAYAQHGRAEKVQVRDALDGVAGKDVLSNWQRLWLAYTAGALRGTRQQRAHVKWLQSMLDSDAPGLAAHSALALARLGHADAPALAATTARLSPAWRSMVFLALATIDDGLAATIADNELDRILLRECRP
jgi:hypothetical protein